MELKVNTTADAFAAGGNSSGE